MDCVLDRVSAMDVKWGNGGRKSRPWKSDEMIWIDGVCCVYTVDSKGVQVHMPGGNKVALSVLRQSLRGRIVDPKHWRMDSYE